MKTTAHMICIILTICGFIYLPCAEAAPPEISAKSAILIEAETGKILYEKNADERRYPASTTKMMTLIIALENGRLDDQIVTSSRAASTEGSSMWLELGEILPMKDVLYGMMLVSGNDATVAIAEHIAGSVERFADMMNWRAQQIGATNTHFVNPNGLPNPDHYSTARDLAKIAAYGYQNPNFVQFVSAKREVIPWPGKPYDRDLYNENKLLWRYDGANGVKTGYTDASGPTLVSGAKRDGIQLIAVVLDSDRMWADSAALLDYGFKQLRPVTFIHAGDVLKTVKVRNGKKNYVELVAATDSVIPVGENGTDDFQTEVEVNQPITAPVYQGQSYGQVKILYQGRPVSSVSLVAAYDVEYKSLFRELWFSIRALFAHLWKTVA